MTGKEAIDYLLLIKMLFDNNYVHEALDIAIESLSTEAISRENCDQCKIDQVCVLQQQLAELRGDYETLNKAYNDALDDRPQAEPMTEEVREALLRLTMCAREECAICKYKNKCNFDFRYKESTKNMNTILDSLMRSKCEVDANWIPVSERLPKEEKKTYWVCTDTEYQCECRWTNNRFGIGEGEWGWSIFDTPQYSKPIAWMPLPPTYREENEE